MKASIYLKSHDVYEEYEEIYGEDYSGGELCAVAKLVLDICIKDSKGKDQIFPNSLIIRHVGIYRKSDGAYVLRYPPRKGREASIHPVDTVMGESVCKFVIEKYIKHKKNVDFSRILNDD